MVFEGRGAGLERSTPCRDLRIDPAFELGGQGVVKNARISFSSLNYFPS